MNELKTEDVMRALELCNFNAECDDCPYVGRCWDLNIDALALLREKDAEIERLKGENEYLKKVEQAFNDCVDQIQKDQAEVKYLKHAIRAEAITEFADRLKEAVKYIPWCDYPPVHNCIDEIAEKLKGATDGKSDL